MDSRSDATADRRLPALDGLRAIAVALVLAYHGGVPGLATAGFYGVDVFFVLSGFLITRLLLAERDDHGRIRFAVFWSRRARRLLPALLVMLIAVEGYVAHLAPTGRYPGFRGDALSTVAYWSNWHFIQASSNYFSATGWPSLLTHTWSLAIEEQFYVVWPVILWCAVRLAGRTQTNPARWVLAISGVGSLASAAWMGGLYRSGASLSRLYYGTDTHAQSILVGCALAALAALVPVKVSHRTATVVSVMAGGTLGWAACSLGSSNPITYQGGFLLVSVSAALLVAVVVGAPSTLPSRGLSLPPLAYVGRISYGMYLWYFPLFAILDRETTGLGGAELFGLRGAADVVAAVISFHLIEQPIRRWRPRPRIHAPAGVGTLALGGTAALAAAWLVAVGTPAGGLAASPAAVAAPTPVTGDDEGMRILVFGDSTARTLGDDMAFSPDAQQHRIAVDVVGILGCGLAASTEVISHGQASPPAVPCRVGSRPQDQWPALLHAEIAAFHPAVVLFAAGRWEVDTRRSASGGSWVNIGDAQDAAYIASQMRAAASIVIGSGARLALATAPCYSSGEQPNGDPWPEDGADRVHAYNSLVRQVVAEEAATHRGRVTVVDLYAMVCPGGRFHAAIDGVIVRAPDGVHYPFFDVYNVNAPAPDTVSQAKAFGTWIEPKVVRAIMG